MSTRPAIDGDADTVFAEPSQPYGADFASATVGAESELTTEAAGDGGAADAPTRLPVAGQQLGDFTLLTRLGEGGMGVVYAAWSHKLARRVAIKIPTRALDPVVRARLVREAQSLAQVDHPNVVRVHDVVDDARDLFIVMELVEGVTLRRWQTEAPRDWQTVLGMYLQAGRGLAAAHHQGLIHRDFKPSNILVDREGKVRLIDFGLARMRDSSVRTATDPGHESPPTDTDEPSQPDTPPSGPEFVLTSRAGTPRYMAPELYETGTPVDARSDQYAFCVALWEGLFGELPDWRRTLPEARAAQVPAWLVRVLRRGLALTREERYPTMDALLADLAAGLQPPRRRPRVALALAAVLGAGAGLAVRAGPDVSACPAPDALAESLWPAAQRAALRDAGDSALSAETWLSDHVQKWASARAEACQSSPRWDAHARARAERCLGERERALREIARVLADDPAARLAHDPSGAAPRLALAADPRRPWDARLALWDRALAPASDCVDPRYLAWPVDPPAHFDLSEVSWLEDHLQSGAALALAGDPDAAEPRLHQVLGRADAIGDRWRRARGTLALGIARLNRGDEAGARRRFEAAAAEAGAAGDDFLVADAWRWLVFLDATRDPDPGRALLLLPHAESTLHRIGQASGPRMVDLQLSAAYAELRRGDLDAAHDRLARALQHATGVDEVLAARVLRHHAEQAHQRGEHLPAIDLARQALSLQLRLDGPDARSVADTRQSLARYQLAGGQLAEAEANLRAALTVAASDPDARERASLETALAVVLYTRGDLDGARAAADRASAGFAESPDPHAGRLDRIALAKLRGDLSLEAGDPTTALREYHAGLALTDAARDIPDARDNGAAMRVGVAAAHHQLRDLSGAAAALAPVLADLPALSPTTAAYALATAAELDLARGDRRSAEAHCQHALALLPERDPMVPELRQLLATIQTRRSGERDPRGTGRQK